MNGTSEDHSEPVSAVKNASNTPREMGSSRVSHPDIASRFLFSEDRGIPSLPTPWLVAEKPQG